MLIREEADPYQKESIKIFLPFEICLGDTLVKTYSKVEESIDSIRFSQNSAIVLYDSGREFFFKKDETDGKWRVISKRKAFQDSLFQKDMEKREFISISEAIYGKEISLREILLSDE